MRWTRWVRLNSSYLSLFFKVSKFNINYSYTMYSLKLYTNNFFFLKSFVYSSLMGSMMNCVFGRAIRVWSMNNKMIIGNHLIKRGIITRNLCHVKNQICFWIRQKPKSNSPVFCLITTRKSTKTIDECLVLDGLGQN